MLSKNLLNKLTDTIYNKLIELLLVSNHSANLTELTTAAWSLSTQHYEATLISQLSFIFYNFIIYSLLQIFLFIEITQL